MQQDIFYKEIQEKLNLLETNSDWNKDAVWNRINRQEEVTVLKKSNRRFYFGAAASIVLVSLIGFLILNNKQVKSIDNQQVTSLKVESKSAVEVDITKKKVEEKTIRTIIYKKDSKVQDNQVVLINTPNIVSETTVEQKTPPKVEVVDSPQIVQNQVIEAEKEVNAIQETEEDHYDRKVSKPTPNRVVVLNIPVAEEENDRGKQKKNFIGKIFKKNDHPKPERSDKIWAFVKESFKNESIEEKKDSTVR
jgi:hypothetical protein